VGAVSRGQRALIGTTVRDGLLLTLTARHSS
jgi:hypothetical protein